MLVVHDMLRTRKPAAYLETWATWPRSYGPQDKGISRPLKR